MAQHTESKRLERFDWDGRERDKLGRVTPHRLNAVGFARAVPGLLEQFSEELPHDNWRRYQGSARIKCPCQGDEALPPSERPAVEPGRLLGCDDCDRVFLFTGSAVRFAMAAPREQLTAAA